MDSREVFFGHDLSNFGEQLVLGHLVDQVTIDVARENGLVVSLSHGLVRHFDLLHDDQALLIHLCIADPESGVRASQNCLVKLAHFFVVRNLDHVFNLLVALHRSTTSQ